MRRTVAVSSHSHDVAVVGGGVFSAGARDHQAGGPGHEPAA
ncbi:hypothetical protein AB2L27_02980 [Kineococcus sp. LSe6-4]|uniref:Uncharacterized protein n=1 Tax=Kineococcus halophytocola TaxID=3234027 RepID=A0ABV4GZ54_9ACTN